MFCLGASGSEWSLNLVPDFGLLVILCGSSPHFPPTGRPGGDLLNFVDNIDKNENEIMEFNNIIHIHKEAETKDENNEGHHTKENTIYKYRDNVPNSTKYNEFHRNADDDSDTDDVTVTKPASGTIVKNQQLDIPYGQTDNLWINDDDDW